MKTSDTMIVLNNLLQNITHPALPLFLLVIIFDYMGTEHELFNNLMYEYFPFDIEREFTLLFSGTFKELYLNGYTHKEISYLHGQKHGQSKEWDVDGSLYQEISYLHGQMHGRSNEWYPNGFPAWEIPYHHGTVHGKYKTWYSNGRMMIVRYFYNGESYKTLSWNIDGNPMN